MRSTRLFLFVVLVFISSIPFAFAEFGTGLHYWKGDDNQEDSIGSNTLTTSDGTAGYAAGIINNAFDGSEIVYNDTLADSDNIRTIDFWFDYPDTVNGYFFYLDDGTATNRFSMYAKTAPDELETLLTIGGANKCGGYLSDAGNLAGGLHHIVAKFGTNGFKVYIDGTERISAACTDVPTVAFDKVSLCPDTAACDYIDNIYLTEHNYTSSDVTDSYNGGAGYEFSTTSPSSINVTIDYPVNNYAFNESRLEDVGHNIQINLTSNQTNATCYINDTNFISLWDTNLSRRFDYQEHANSTRTQYQYKNEENYSNDGSWTLANPFHNFIDGDYTTSAIVSGPPPASARVYINYTKPDYAIFGSLIQLKTEHETINLTINDSCWSWNDEKLSFKVTSFTGGAADENTLLDCFNGSGWTRTYSTPTDIDHYIIYEEGIYWKYADDSFYNNTPLSDGIYNLEITCNDTVSTVNGSDTVTFKIDTAFPTITLNEGNGFTTLNISNVSNYHSSLPLNFTFNDNIQLFAYEINISQGSFIGFNITNTTLNSQQANYSDILDVSSWDDGLYNIFVTSSDAHTKTRIEDYSIAKTLNKLTFNTEEKNVVQISSIGAIGTDAIKEKDRYSFEFNYLLSDSERTYIVESDKKIHYYPDSKYKAHFVVWNNDLKQGNWIDFEGYGNNYEVNKVSDFKYEVIFRDLPVTKSAKFSSIGGLNVYEVNYEWYKGNYSLDYTTPATTGSSQTFSLNITKEVSATPNIEASFVYDGTQRTVTKTNTSTYANFEADFNIPESEETYNFTWYINVTKPDGKMYNFTVDDQQDVFFATLNITFYDEENRTLITEDITAYLTLEQTRESTTSTGNLLLGNLTLGEYFIQAESENYPRRGVYFTIVNQSQNLDVYLVKDLIGNQYIDYYVRNTGKENLEDVRLTFQRLYNGTYTTVAQFETDYAGQGQIFQDQQNEYRVILDHDDYPIKTIDLIPLQTSYEIILDSASESAYDSVFQGISYRLYPKDRILNVTDEFVPIILDIYASDSSLEWYAVRLTNHSYECIPSSCLHNVTGNPSGGTAMVQIKGNYSGTFDVEYIFKRTGFGVQYIHGSLYGFQIIEAFLGHNFAVFVEELRSSVGGKVALAVLAGVGTAALVALASQMGIVGLGVLLVVVMANIFFTLAGFIDGIIGMITIIVGILLYVILARDG